MTEANQIAGCEHPAYIQAYFQGKLSSRPVGTT